MSLPLDIAGNRQQRKYSRREQLQRVLWGLAWPLFRLSPRPLWGWRRWLLRCFGARIGEDVHIYPSVRIFLPSLLSVGDQSAVGEDVLLYNLGPLRIGRQSTISHRAHLCGGSHDDSDPRLPLIRAPIEIGDGAWICADAFLGPGVRIGDRAVVGARAVVVREVTADQVVAGNPARVLRRRQLGAATPE